MVARSKKRSKARRRSPRQPLDRTPALEGIDSPLARVDAGSLGRRSKRKKKLRKPPKGQKFPTLAERNRPKPKLAPPSIDPDEAMRRHAASLSTDLHHAGMPTLRERIQREGFKTQLRGRTYGVPGSGKKKRAPKAKATE